MKQWLAACLLLCITSVCSAQGLALRDDAGMKAEVRNRLGGTSVMTALTPDSLSLQVSPALRVDMLLLPLAEPIDTVDQVIVVGETFLVDSIYGETTLRYFTPTWQLIPVPPLSESQQKRIAGFSLQTILKWGDELIKKVNFKI